MYRFKLYASMIGTLTIFIAISTLAFILISEYAGWGLYYGLTFAFIFNIIQWIMAPKIIETIYKVKPLRREEAPEIHEMIERISDRVGIKKPEVMIANMDVPNAFAYGSPFGRKKVAVTRGLLKVLDEGELEAVLGHEIGHIAHRDVTTMMFLSVLPSIFYIVSRIALYQMYFSSFGGRDRDNASILMMGIGILSFIIYIILNMILLGFSRLREYYADYESSIRVDNGANKLMSALAKISSYSHRVKKGKELAFASSFKALLITDPDTYKVSAYEREIDRIISKKITLTDRIMELFSTHPNIVKRLRKLKELAERGV
jgi:heat shock protein HtpX